MFLKRFKDSRKLGNIFHGFYVIQVSIGIKLRWTGTYLCYTMDGNSEEWGTIHVDFQRIRCFVEQVDIFLCDAKEVNYWNA